MESHLTELTTRIYLWINIFNLYTIARKIDLYHTLKQTHKIFEMVSFINTVTYA